MCQSLKSGRTASRTISVSRPSGSERKPPGQVDVYNYNEREMLSRTLLLSIFHRSFSRGTENHVSTPSLALDLWGLLLSRRKPCSHSTARASPTRRVRRSSHAYTALAAQSCFMQRGRAAHGTAGRKTVVVLRSHARSPALVRSLWAATPSEMLFRNCRRGFVDGRSLLVVAVASRPLPAKLSSPGWTNTEAALHRFASHYCIVL